MSKLSSVRRLAPFFCMCWLACCARVFGPGRRAAADPPHPLRPLPPAQVVGLGAATAQPCDMTLLEADASGNMSQITVLSLSSAPPDLLHDVVMGPELYGDFVRNMTLSQVRRCPTAAKNIATSFRIA